MNYRVIVALFGVCYSTIVAAEPIVFKQALSPKNGWLQYGLAITVLLILILVLAKKYKYRTPNLSSLQLIEKKHLGNKTVVYVIEYQQQRFILADNQQALAIHPLNHPETNESVNKKPHLGQESEKPFSPARSQNQPQRPKVCDAV